MRAMKIGIQFSETVLNKDVIENSSMVIWFLFYALLVAKLTLFKTFPLTLEVSPQCLVYFS
jgi:hypothetical protein